MASPSPIATISPSTSSETSISSTGATPASSVPSPIAANPPTAEQDPPFRIAIIGGGIGGLTAALFIDQVCNTAEHRKIETSIYEQASEYREIGAGIGLGANATKLFARLESKIDGTPLLDAINVISGSRNGVWFDFRRFDTGEEILAVPRNEPEDARIRMVSVNRAELHSILLRHVQAKFETIGGGRLFTGKKLVSIDEVSKSARMTFQDGTTAIADLVIAADGIRSAVRRQFSADEPVYGNKIIYRGLIPFSSLPNPWPLDSHAAMWIAIGAHFLMYPISADKTINVIACKDKQLTDIGAELSSERWFATCERSELEEDFAEFTDPLVQEVIRLMPREISKWRLNDRRPIESWVFMGGKVVLLGDAAHPMVPHQSAGAGQAVEDGYILAKALGQFLLLKDDASGEQSIEPGIEKEKLAKGNNALERWMTLYQNVRMPRAARTQESSRKAGELFELIEPEMECLSYEERLPSLREQALENTKWIWTEDIDAAWEMALSEMA
ncbi:salicylate hydroxylase [Rhypophila sp. PSN 637]